MLAPGFVNAHAHLDLGAARGLPAPAGGFLDWVGAVLEGRASMGEAEVRAGVRASARRLLETGTTTVIDVDAAGGVSGALGDLPLRVVALREVLDGSPAGSNERTAQALVDARGALSLAPTERRASGLSPHGVHTVGDELLQQLGRLRGDAPIAVHWAETPEETLWMTEGSGPFSAWLGPSPMASGAERLERAGMLEGVMLVHGNCPARGEAAALAGRGVTVVHCPGSHLYFGRAPFEAAGFMGAGVPLALGTDSWASNDDLDMRREVRLAREELGMSGPEAWRMATEAGARHVPWPHVSGRLGVGDAADLQRLRPVPGGAELAGDPEGLLDELTRREPDVVSVWIHGERVHG